MQAIPNENRERDENELRTKTDINEVGVHGNGIPCPHIWKYDLGACCQYEDL